MKGIGICIFVLFSFVNLHAQVDLHTPDLPQVTEPAALPLRYQHIIQTPYFEDFASRNKNNFSLIGLNTHVQGQTRFFISGVNTELSNNTNLFLPAYTQGIFCDFEDHINRKRQLRIDFSLK